MPWLLMVGGQAQGSRLCVRDEATQVCMYVYVCICIYIYIYIYIYTYIHTCIHTQGVSGGIVNILGGGRLDSSE
jgi:hypothetical protein